MPSVKRPQRDPLAEFVIRDQQPGDELEGARLLPLELIDPNPWQPRQHTDWLTLQHLIQSIKQSGVIEPIIVRERDGRFQVIAGERRYMAAKEAELKDMPCIVRELTDPEALALSLTENWDREDMDPEDEGRALQMLNDSGLSLRKLGELIHKSHNYVNRRIALASDPAALLAYRSGRANLDQILSGDFVVQEDVATGQQAEVVTERNSVGQAPAVTERNTPRSDTYEEVTFLRMDSIYKPLHKVVLSLRKVRGHTLPDDERAKYRDALLDTIKELQEAVEQLED